MLPVRCFSCGKTLFENTDMSKLKICCKRMFYSVDVETPLLEYATISNYILNKGCIKPYDIFAMMIDENVK